MVEHGLERLREALPVTAAGYGIAMLILISFYISGMMVYNLYFHPLSAYPGPFWARSSRLWYVNSLLRGKLPFDVHRMHLVYGNVVRVAPDELAYTNADAWKDIWGLRSGKGEIPKDPNFYSNTAAGGLSIIAAPAERHGQLRRLLSHGFSEKALREQEPIVQSYLDLFIRRLRDLSTGNEPIDIVDWYNFFTFDVIGDLAFGESFGCLEKSTIHPWIHMIMGMIGAGSWAHAADYYPGLKSLLMNFAPKSLLEGHRTHVALMKQKALHRLNMDTDRMDFMTKMAAPDSGLTREEFIASADVVLLGGSETTSTLLSGATYYLLKNPRTLEKLTQEIRSKFTSEDQIDFASVNTLDYMLACLNETFRVYPPVPGGLPRRTHKGEILAGKYVPPNTTLAIYQWAMHRNPAYFSRVDEFIPERWQGDPEFAEDNRAALQPFSVGARNCIGRNLAYVEMRLMLARLLYNFDIEPTAAIEGWTEQKVHILWMKPALWIKLRARDIKSRPEVEALLSADEVAANDAREAKR